MSDSPTQAPDRLVGVQFVNTLARADGGPARNSLEVNLALNALSGVAIRMFWFSGNADDSVLRGEARAAPLVASVVGRRWQALRAIRHADVAIMHGFYLWWVPLVALACAVSGVPYVIMPHGVFTAFQRTHSQGRKRIFDTLGGRSILRRAAAVVVASPSERDELLEFAPDTRTAITGVGTGVVAHPAVGPAHTPATLVSMSRIAPKKRIDVVIETIAELRRRNVAARLSIAGTGDETLVANLHALAKQLGVEDSVDFVGEIAGERKRDLLTGSDVFLAPSEDENFGIAVAEALAHGLPVVATERVSSAAIADGEAGVVIPSPSAERAADAVIALLEHDDFASLRARATQLATQHYAWSAVGRQWEAALRRAAGR
ncbi:glycosyltransferase [Microbacterium thalassium]|uniref:Glycosyltransferase involved in cell wall biosynthesis n=1 Tax=Microbacterium thalassium TaxID=362649 RepID=A0A7X0FP90_9MICO|nr:glycosyltransferase [Microbacterium thalassium]MBB6391064.1 glycosyltransferase involved in cell wall biosynthesis [Microbacterium thalassium]GLK23826.1 hypothetical protein GCM10017607_11440 [Microbacterium thalassium]